MYHLAAMHSVTDRQTDKRHYHGNSRSYCGAVQSAKKNSHAPTPLQKERFTNILGAPMPG